MFPVARRKRIIAVAVTVPDCSVRTVDDNFAMLTNRPVARRVNRIALRRVNGTGTVRAFSPHRPSAIMGWKQLSPRPEEPHSAQSKFDCHLPKLAVMDNVRHCRSEN